MNNSIKQLNNCRSFAIFGGTFDPIHIGHTESARAIKKITGVEKILFLPNGEPPYKNEEKITDAEIRFEMTAIAIEDTDDFVITDIETKRKGKTYTVDTIKELRSVFGNDIKIYFVLGADAIRYVPMWKGSDEIFKLCSFIGTTRPGYNTEILKKDVEMMKEKYGADIIFAEVPENNISSSEIREKIKNGSSVKGLLSEKVENYIKEKGLYKD